MFNFLRRKKFNRNNRNRNLNYKLISFEKAKEIINNEENIVIDVRTEKEYNVMHIKNSVNIPVDHLSYSEAEYKNKEKILLYCSSGIRTKEATAILNNMGYDNIYIWEYGSLANFPFKEMISV